MTSLNGFQRLAAALTMSVVVAGGCQQMKAKLPKFAAKPKAAAPADKPVHLNDRQVADIQMAMARSLEQQGDLEKARAGYLEVIGHDPKRGDAYHRLAIIHDRQGKFEKSAEYFQKALKLQPGNADLFCDIGYSQYLQRNWRDAEMNLRQALAIEDEHKRSHSNLGMVYAQSNRPEEAFAEFRKGGCSPADAHMNLAFALTTQHRWRDARDEYRRALEANPSSQVAKSRLQELESMVAKIEAKPDDDSKPIQLAAMAEADERPAKNVETATRGGERLAKAERPVTGGALASEDGGLAEGVSADGTRSVPATVGAKPETVHPLAAAQPAMESKATAAARPTVEPEWASKPQQTVNVQPVEAKHAEFEPAELKPAPQQVLPLVEMPETSSTTDDATTIANDAKPDDAVVTADDSAADGTRSVPATLAVAVQADVNESSAGPVVKEPTAEEATAEAATAEDPVDEGRRRFFHELVIDDKLYLSGTPITDAAVQYLRGHATLEELYLDSTNVTDAGVEHLKGITTIRALWLSHTQVTDRGLAHVRQLSNLRELRLDGAPITDAGLAHLTGLRNLKSISLRETQVTPAGIKRLQTALPTVEVIR